MRYEFFLFFLLIFSIALIEKIKIYATIAGLFIGQFLNIFLLAGNNTYVSMLSPFNIAFGIGGFFYFLENIKILKKYRTCFVILSYIVIIGFVANKRTIIRFNEFFIRIREMLVGGVINRAPFVINALDIIDRNLIPGGSSLLTEDDIIYSLVVNSPKHYFKKMFAFPYFNILSDEERESILKNIDFIYISKLNHETFFLICSDEVRWKDDSFRRNIINLLRSGQSFSLYNVTFRLVEESGYGFLIKVEKSKK
jgi:hypothetical protein